MGLRWVWKELSGRLSRLFFLLLTPVDGARFGGALTYPLHLAVVLRLDWEAASGLTFGGPEFAGWRFQEREKAVLLGDLLRF